MDHLQDSDLIGQAARLAQPFETAIHSVRGARHVQDIRNFGLAGAIQLAPRAGDALVRPYEAGIKLWQAGFYVRWGGDNLQFGPPFDTTQDELTALFDQVAQVLNDIA